MTLFIIMAPLMVLAVAIAAVPVLYLSVREHNLIHHGQASRPRRPTPVYAVRSVRRSASEGSERMPLAA